MTTPFLSIQEVLDRRRSDATFVGRDSELDCFREQLALAGDDPRRRFVLSFDGQGGVGKSTLLRRFQRLAVDERAAVALSNDDEDDVAAAMALTRRGRRRRPVRRLQRALR